MWLAGRARDVRPGAQEGNFYGHFRSVRRRHARTSQAWFLPIPKPRRVITMRRIVTIALIAGLGLLPVAGVRAADDSKVKERTNQVEDGARKICQGEVVQGVSDTAKGVGGTVVEGGKYVGEKVKESGREAEPQARSAWGHTRDGGVAFGRR